MKKLFYFLIPLFFTTVALAQKSIQYVSFFPPSVSQNNVILTQNENSFSLLEVNSYNSNTSYHTFQGGLILGATDGAEVTINNMNITAGNTNAINKIQVDNALKIFAPGKADKIYLGNNCISNSCTGIFLSAGDITLNWNNVTPGSGYSLSNYTVKLNSNMLVYARKIYLLQKDSTYKEFLPGIAEGHHLGWVRLRLKGTSTCRKYLVRYTGNSKPADNCNF